MSENEKAGVKVETKAALKSFNIQWGDGSYNIEAADLDAAVEQTEKEIEDCAAENGWLNDRKTIWVNYEVSSEATDEDGDPVESVSDTLAIDPSGPGCADGRDEHDWRSPYSVVGGLQENPGVWGHNGGVRIHKVCPCCGWYKVDDTSATDPSTGKGGLEAIEYEEPDEKSEAYVLRMTCPYIELDDGKKVHSEEFKGLAAGHWVVWNIEEEWVRGSGPTKQEAIDEWGGELVDGELPEGLVLAEVQEPELP
jgi:hypothetical protein